MENETVLAPGVTVAIDEQFLHVKVIDVPSYEMRWVSISAEFLPQLRDYLNSVVPVTQKNP